MSLVFDSARLKLTAWYLLIIMVISIFFSIGMYRLLSDEVDRFAKEQSIRMQKRIAEKLFLANPEYLQNVTVNYEMDPDIINDAKQRIVWSLTLVNIFILVVSGGLGYFLAGKTLNPIKEMIDEQNRFITDASHELRTPLTALKSSMEVYLRDKNPTLNDANLLAKDALEEVNNMQQLSDNLLKLSQYQKSKIDIEFDKINFNEVINNALTKVKVLYEQKNIKIINNTNEFYVYGNKQMLTDLLVILLDNAIKYSYDDSEVVLASKIKRDRSKSFSIQDFGIGIEKTDIPNIFDRFYRADKARNKSNISGYGLGLSIAKKIVDVHKASITVESKVKNDKSNDSGTKFTICFS